MECGREKKSTASDTSLFVSSSPVRLSPDPIIEGGTDTFQSDRTITHQHFRILADNMDHTDLDIPEAYIIKNHIHEAAYEATMQARAAARETNTVDSHHVTKTSQTQSTAGFERIEAKDLVDLIQRDEANSCTKNEVPYSTISVLTALMDDLRLATEEGMTNVPLSSDSSSEDGWSVVSGGNDFVVIDAAETARQISNDRAKKKPEVPPRPVRQARPKSQLAHQQGAVAGQNNRREATTVCAAHDSRREQLEHGQKSDRYKKPDDMLDRIANRHPRFAKYTRQALSFDGQLLLKACLPERDGESSC